LQEINGLVTVVKLGGSSITFKERTFSVDEDALSNISSALSNFNGRLFVVHGGGSWGHPVAAAHGLSSFSYSNDIRGASRTRLAMLELTKRVQRSLIDHGLNVFFFPPQHLESMLNDLEGIYQLKAVPLTYGDVIYEREKGYRIIGGDEIISRLAASQKINRVLFIMRSSVILDIKG
jgi:isopentenyl phosphate kinase